MKFFKLFLYFPLIVVGVKGWAVENGQIYKTKEDTKTLFHVKGLSWFGFETQDFVVDGLWQHPMETYLDQLQSLKITTLRVPFSAEWIYYNFDLLFGWLISFNCDGLQ